MDAQSIPDAKPRHREAGQQGEGRMEQRGQKARWKTTFLKGELTLSFADVIGS